MPDKSHLVRTVLRVSVNDAAHFSVFRLCLTTDQNTRRRLDRALLAAGHLERALTRWALANLEALRRTDRWRDACALPTGLLPNGEVVDDKARKLRNAALNSLRREFHLTDYDFTAKILELRRESRWICAHVPSSSALVHATRVWESFAAHLFRGAGLPTVSQPWENRVLEGYVRYQGRGEATLDEVERARAMDRTPPKARAAEWSGISMREAKNGNLYVHLHPSREHSRHLVIHARVLGGDQAARESWYLDDPDAWRQVRIVRRETRHHVVYEAHLLCAKEPYRVPARYASAPCAVVGVDLGVSTLAAVGLGEGDVLTDAILVRPSSTELEKRRVVAAKRRRTLRALERSRRAMNPDAYAPDRHGRAGKGSRKAGTRLKNSRAYRTARRDLRDERRRERETRVMTTNVTASLVVARCGVNIVTEDVVVKAWQKTWGKSLSYFAPSELMAALEREARLAGGSLTKVPCRLGLTQTCHCGAVQKKSLAQRWHRCTSCGAGYATPPVDRDVHSAYLAAFVTSAPSSDVPHEVILDTDRALAAWSGAEAPLVAVSGDPRERRTSQPVSRATSWSRRKASDRAGRAIASDVDPDSLGRAKTFGPHDVGVGKAHAARLRYEASTSEVEDQKVVSSG